jgi:hypothetical protein
MKWADAVLYEYLNKELKMEKTPEDIFLEISELVAELGWVIALNETDNAISGIVAGKMDYVLEVLKNHEDAESFSVFEHGSENENQVH